MLSTGSGEMGPSVQLTIFAVLCSHDPSTLSITFIFQIIKDNKHGQMPLFNQNLNAVSKPTSKKTVFLTFMSKNDDLF